MEAATAVEPMTAPAATAPTMAATEAEAERQARTVIGIIGIAVSRIIISRRGRRAVAVSRRWRGVIIGRLATVFMHAAIIGVGIIGFHIPRRMARIVGA